MSGRLAGKVAVITGSSRGLGQYCAQGYAAEGATVVVTARGARPGQEDMPGTISETVKLIEAEGGKAFPIACDVGNPGSIHAMMQTVLDKFGRIDVVMTNAIRYLPGNISTISPHDWDMSLQVNVSGVFHTIRAALPAMISQRSGSIITISSAATVLDRPMTGNMNRHYGAQKLAVVTLTRGLAEEQASNGIAANSLRPVRAIDTPGSGKGRSPEQTQARLSRMSPPDSYVEAAILLASQTPETCTGKDYTDAQAIKHLGREGDFERFKAMNASLWSEGL